MSTVPVSTPRATEAVRSLPAWFESEALWAGFAIIMIWLAVLFVGLFGGDIVSGTSAAGFPAGDSVPSVVPIGLFASLATPFVAFWGFAARRSRVRTLSAALTEERIAREELAAEVAELRTRVG